MSLLFVTKDDKVYGFGNNRFGRFGFGHETDVNAPKEPQEMISMSGKRVKEFFVGTDFVLALTEDITLYSWGWNKNGQLGRGVANTGCHTPAMIHLPVSMTR